MEVIEAVELQRDCAGQDYSKEGESVPWGLLQTFSEVAETFSKTSVQWDMIFTGIQK